jgi:hypothetical protein
VTIRAQKALPGLPRSLVASLASLAESGPEEVAAFLHSVLAGDRHVLIAYGLAERDAESGLRALPFMDEVIRTAGHPEGESDS